MVSSIQRGLFVTGTGTGDGKTHIAAILAHQQESQPSCPPRQSINTIQLKNSHENT